MVIFLCVPLGLLAGFITGLIVGLCTAATGFGGFLKVQGLSLASLIGLGAIVTGLFWIGADKPPVIGGKTLTLDFELRVPPGVAFPAEPAYSNVHASLYANDRDNRVAEIDFHSIRREGDNVIAPGTAPLMSHSSNRSLLAQIEGESGSSQFIPVKLPPSPRKADEAWSDWIVADEQADLSPIPEPQRMAVRYRVRPISE